MKKFVHALVLPGLVGVSTFAMAAEPASPHTISGNIAMTSDYLFRGVSQTQNGPAIQGGFDYAHASGFYVGTWASNVAWVEKGGYKEDSSMEINLYGGYRGSMGDFGYDVGAITYYYPGDKISGVKTPDTTELYAGASWKFLSLKYSRAVSQNFIGWYDYALGKKTRGSQYIELNANYDLGNGWGIAGHVGHQKVKNLSDADYTDWKVGVSKDVGFGTVALAYSSTNADDDVYVIDGEKIADGRAILTFSKSF